MHQRRIPLQGAINFRDLGGYSTTDDHTVRWRCIFRSDSLSELTVGDLNVVENLSIETICDFRLNSEREKKPNKLPKNKVIKEVRIPFVPSGTHEMIRSIKQGKLTSKEVKTILANNYKKIAIDHTFEYSRLLHAINEPAALPFLMHCTSGKDRTGFGAAIVLMALGVSKEQIMEDYSLTNLYRRDIKYLLHDTVTNDVIDALTAAKPCYLESAIYAIIDKWNSFDNYFTEALNFSESKRIELRNKLLE